MVAFKIEQNLKNSLLRGDTHSTKPDLMDSGIQGYKKNNNKRCDSCQSFVDETSIRSHATGRIFKIRLDITSATSNVTYITVLYVDVKVLDQQYTGNHGYLTTNPTLKN